LDRLGRSLRHLIDLVAELEQRGVGLRSLTESIDTSTPGGRLIFHVFGALAEFEWALIVERTQAGLVAARARGRVGGRPTVWTPEKLRTARSMHASGEHDVAGIARVLGVSRASVYRVLSGASYVGRSGPQSVPRCGHDAGGAPGERLTDDEVARRSATRVSSGAASVSRSNVSRARSSRRWDRPQRTSRLRSATGARCSRRRRPGRRGSGSQP